jgi:ABC-type polysaccharide/polyol phosphate export permease
VDVNDSCGWLDRPLAYVHPSHFLRDVRWPFYNNRYAQLALPHSMNVKYILLANLLLLCTGFLTGKKFRYATCSIRHWRVD